MLGPELLPRFLTAFFGTLVPFATASGHWSRCGAWTRTGAPTRCRRVRRGPLVRCHDHGGTTLSDALGLPWAMAALCAGLLLALPLVLDVLDPTARAELLDTLPRPEELPLPLPSVLP